MTNTKTRTSRSSQTRDKTAKRQPWRPPSRLDAPQAPDGFQYRWIRAEIMGQEDKKNVSSRIREGYELVRLEELGDFAFAACKSLREMKFPHSLQKFGRDVFWNLCSKLVPSDMEYYDTDAVVAYLRSIQYELKVRY